MADCKKVPFEKEYVEKAVENLLANDTLEAPTGMTSISKGSLTQEMKDDLCDALVSFFMFYVNPSPESVCEYYLTNRGGTKMKPFFVDAAKKATGRTMVTDTKQSADLFYTQELWKALSHTNISKRTDWGKFLDCKDAGSVCFWRTNQPLTEEQYALNHKDKEFFSNTVVYAVLFQCDDVPDDLLRSGNTVLFADVQYAIELDDTFDNEIVTFGRRYWFNEKTGKWFPEGTALVVPSRGNYYPSVLF
ncbi:hypothetical protein FACS1894170_05610 [Planctomycetales bacterium]|nr:hypothetical protein FACS1894170_05610 [Planctomycetales bacterium]